MSITALQRAQYAYRAGFRNTSSMESLAIAVAISLTVCPVGQFCETNCVGGNEGGGGTCGLMGISENYAGDAQASDPQGSFNLAYQISHQGSNFTPWTAWNDGSFRNNLTAARNAVTQMSTPAGPPTPAPPPITVKPTQSTSNMLTWALLALAGAGGIAVYKLNQKAHKDLPVSVPSRPA